MPNCNLTVIISFILNPAYIFEAGIDEFIHCSLISLSCFRSFIHLQSINAHSFRQLPQYSLHLSCLLNHLNFSLHCSFKLKFHGFWISLIRISFNVLMKLLKLLPHATCTMTAEVSYLYFMKNTVSITKTQKNTLLCGEFET